MKLLNILLPFALLSQLSKNLHAQTIAFATDEQKTKSNNLLDNIAKKPEGLSAKILDQLKRENFLFVIADLSQEPVGSEIRNGADGEAAYIENRNLYFIKVNENLLDSNQERAGAIIEHELVHLGFNRKFANTPLCRNNENNALPYCSATEKKSYINALGDFNNNLADLADKLLKVTVNKEHSHILTNNDKKIIGLLQRPFSFVSQNTKDGSTEEIYGGVNAKASYLDNPTFYSKYNDGSNAYRKTVKFENPTDQALATIGRYVKSLSDYPQERQHSEQPAFMVQYFDNALEYISPKMFEHMNKSLGLEIKQGIGKTRYQDSIQENQVDKRNFNNQHEL